MGGKRSERIGEREKEVKLEVVEEKASHWEERSWGMWTAGGKGRAW